MRGFREENLSLFTLDPAASRGKTQAMNAVIEFLLGPGLLLLIVLGVAWWISRWLRKRAKRPQ